MSDTLICILQCLLTATCWICHRYPSLQASSPVALWQWSRKRKESLQLHLWNLNSTSNSPMALRQLSSLSDFRQTAQSGNNCKCIQTLKASAKGIVITSLLMSSLLISISHRLFRSRYSNSRDMVGSCSFLYPPHRQSALESLLAGYQYLWVNKTNWSKYCTGDRC